MYKEVFPCPVQALVVVYAFSRPFLLKEQIQTSEDLKVYKHHILQVILKVPVMCFLASIFSFIFLQLVCPPPFPQPFLLMDVFMIRGS